MFVQFNLLLFIYAELSSIAPDSTRLFAGCSLFLWMIWQRERMRRFRSFNLNYDWRITFIVNDNQNDWLYLRSIHVFQRLEIHVLFLSSFQQSQHLLNYREKFYFALKYKLVWYANVRWYDAPQISKSACHAYVRLLFFRATLWDVECWKQEHNQRVHTKYWIGLKTCDLNDISSNVKFSCNK